MPVDLPLCFSRMSLQERVPIPGRPENDHVAVLATPVPSHIKVNSPESPFRPVLGQLRPLCPQIPLAYVFVDDMHRADETWEITCGRDEVNSLHVPNTVEGAIGMSFCCTQYSIREVTEDRRERCMSKEI